MSRVEKISVSLTGEMLDEVRKAVASGSYASTSEVVRDALRDWQRRQEERANAIAELRRLVAEADASGYEDGPFDIEEILAEGRRRLAQQAK